MRRVNRFLRPFVQQTMSPRTVQSLRYGSWCLLSCLPRIVGSRFVRRTPEIRRFGPRTVTSELAERIKWVNMLAPTKMCRVMTKYGSDKGRWNYTPLYSALFMERRNHPVRILELGLGSNNPHVLSNMGVFGVPGASLRGWRELFPNATVYGADIDRRILFEEDRIKTFYCDQLDQSAIQSLWSQPELQCGADIIIEDGLHTFEANISFLEGSLGHLRPGGIYVAEDIEWDRIDEWYDRVETVYSKQYPMYEFTLIVLAKHGPNNLVVIRRAAN